MDWDLAIERNREALKRIVATLAAMAGLGPHPEVRAEGEPRRALPRHLHRAVLRLLRPAESATRRLVVIMARGLAATPLRNEKTVPPPRLRRRAPKPTLLRRPGGTGIFVRPGVVLPSPLTPPPCGALFTFY